MKYIKATLPSGETVNIPMGYAVLDSWFKFDGKKFTGMGSRTDYNRDGTMDSHNVEPTGIIMEFR